MSGPSTLRNLIGTASRSTARASSSRHVSSTASTSASATQASIQTPATTGGPSVLSFPNTQPLPHTSNHTATLTLHAHHPYPLDLYTNFAYLTAHSLKIPATRPAFLPTTKSLYTVLKSPFVHKKAQENFEKRTHRRVIKVFDTEKEVLDLWLRYLKRNSIGGVGMKAQVWERVEFGYSSQEGEMIAQQTEARSEEEIENAAKALMKELTEEGPKMDKTAGEAAAPTPTPSATASAPAS